jgi:predicted ATPase/DNA-binding CsgD family transcriptional regulator
MTPGETQTDTRTPERPENNLPLQLTSFVGREREVSEVEGLLGGARLVTLRGPGGSGKTRLALAVASELAEGFEEGPWWIELAPLSAPDLVSREVASVLGVRDAPGRSTAEMLADHIGGTRTLVVLDNCEHLIDACTVLAESLLGSCPNLRVLATSREHLGALGEVSWPVPPLSLPDPRRPLSEQTLPDYESARLFAERARAVKPDFTLDGQSAKAVTRICYRLDGMPLALELAAARIRVLSVEQISERLENSLSLLTGGGRTAEPRQRTLRATLEWSYDLLDEQERRLLGRLSVFAGEWTLQAAEEVCSGDDIGRNGVLDLLSSLVDKSLVLAETGGGGAARYRMLEPVRQYARERLEESGERGRVRNGHAAFFLALAEEAEPALMGARQDVWLERLEREHDNIRAALSWALESGAVEVGLRLAGALGEFWYMRGHLGEARRWLEATLSRGESAESARIKPLALFTWIATEQGDYERSAITGEENLALSRKFGNDEQIALSLYALGLVKMHRNELERAAELMEEAVTLQRASGDTAGLSRTLPALGLVAAARHDYERALEIHEESLMLARAAEDDFMIGFSLGVGALAHLGQGDYDRAEALCVEGLQRSLRQGMVTQAADILHVAAALAGSQGQPARSARLWGAAETLRETLGTDLSPVERSHYGPYVAAAKDLLDEATWEAAWAEGRRLTPEQAVRYAISEDERPTPTTPEPSAYPAGLSAREVEVLGLAAKGMTNAQIAKELFISPRTVNRHLNSIYHKLGVGSRAAAARFAVEHNLA